MRIQGPTRLEDEMNEKKLRVFKVFRPDLSGQCWIAREFSVIENEFDGAEPGDKIIIEITEVTDDEINKLPEFEGW
jgi:hypothetical protein